jgi:hypothetical protein
MYSPIRITHDVTADRNNEDLMILSKDTLDSVIKSVTNKLGLTKQPKRDIMLDKKQDTVDASPFTKKPTLLETLTSGI